MHTVNHMADESVTLLANLLTTNTTLRHLDISECSITDVNVTFLTQALITNTSLRTFVMVRCVVSCTHCARRITTITYSCYGSWHLHWRATAA